MTDAAEKLPAPLTVPAPTPGSGALIAMGRGGMEIRNVDDALKFCRMVHESGLAPKGLESPQKCFVALQAGLELGFSPMRALSAVTVINGRASLMGEAALAKIRTSGVCRAMPEVLTRGEGDARAGVIRFQRHDQPEPIEVAFTVADAKAAGLWKKAGPWSQYPDDMLAWRAVARAGKRYFSDVLLGLAIAEEVVDYPAPDGARTIAAEVVRDPTPDPLIEGAIDVTAPTNPGSAGGGESESGAATGAGEEAEPESSDSPAPFSARLWSACQERAARFAPDPADEVASKILHAVLERCGYDRSEDVPEQLQAQALAAAANAKKPS